jgi:diguanylate cyclase (GGDEF)-like protein/PAS domain S-box-containing protein
MGNAIGNLVDRWSRTALSLCIVYSMMCLVALNFGFGGEQVADLIGAWGSFPIIITLLVLLWPVMTDHALTSKRRLAFRLIFAAELLDIVASIGWGYSELTASVAYGAWPDVLWLFYYPLAAAACITLYFDVGGRMNTMRSLVDLATLVVGFGALLWFTALAPLATMNSHEMAQNWSAASYGIGNGICIIAGAMLAMQVTDWRSERAIAWLVVALVATLVSDLVWVNTQLRQDADTAAPMDLVYHIFYLCMVASAYTQRQQRKLNSSTGGLQGDLRGSLPLVALMVGVVALLDDRLQLADIQAPVLVFVVLAATLLVVIGQALATREVIGLNRQVATRRFDERLTELVRRSSDMIAIIDREGIIRYASPSSEVLLGASSTDLDGRRIEDVRGHAGVQLRSGFEEVLRSPQSEKIASFSIPQENGEKRSYKMVIANLCHVESIGGVTLNIRDTTDATRLNDQLRTLAFHDPLTLLANRSLFSDRVHQAIKHIADGMTPAVLFIDLDNFKTVNDSLGHSAGDALLRNFAKRLVQCTRAGDTVARLGGDEFAVLIDHAPNIEAAMAVARQITDVCRQPFDLDGKQVRVGASIGVALSDRISNVERLMRNADAAMYSAKSRNKGHAEAFQPEMLRAARRRMRVENELTTAIAQQQFEAHYQPIVDLASRHLVGVEALMRWRHPKRGLVLPGDFIALAEETGQIVPMTQWMLNRACADGAGLQRDIALGQGLRVSVNVSSRYLNQGHVAEDVRNALGQNRLAPDCLILEVTESLLLENSKHIERTFAELKTIGVRLALDDFGTGYSSLSYLHRLPIDILKIDRSFVERLGRADGSNDGADAAALAKAILSLADALGLDTVAEGIEFDAQRDILLTLGCKVGQGYLFGKTVPVEEILDAAVTRRRRVLASNIGKAVEYSATGRFQSVKEK